MKIKISIFCLLMLLANFNVVKAQEKYNLPACKSVENENLIGDRFMVQVPEKSILKTKQGDDYFKYFVSFGKRKNRVWLSGIFGMNATTGELPKDYSELSLEVSQKTWMFEDLEGVDAKGKLKNGNYWRYFGAVGEAIKYYDVPLEAANYFDSILDGICYQKRK
ncbi:MAG TPA: hypothetical protein PKY59_01360 [Pyrinomonadaceae bacterium]|nr:hypothetical protein [Pyrinomonadaceae bacterium]